MSKPETVYFRPRNWERWYVYVIVADVSPPLCKIGITKDYDRRLRVFQTSSPYKLTLDTVWPFENRDNAREAERSLHEEYQDQQTYGEWFSASPKDIGISVFETYARMDDCAALWIFQECDDG